jgi:SAM-dependent methyltransferase
MTNINAVVSNPRDTFPVTPRDPLDELRLTLLNPGTTALGLQKLVGELAEIRSKRSKKAWREYTRAFQEHSLLKVLHEDALTARAFRKPRGYAGDGVLTDMIYGSGEGVSLLNKATALGKRIYQAAMNMPIAVATRARRDYLAAYIDEFCLARLNPHILSIACGHLREAALSKTFNCGLLGRYVALDQDRRNLRVVQRSQPSVECMAASIDQLMDSALNPGQFDLIYSAGLYDYLDEDTGRRLLHLLAKLMKPNGRIIIANFLPGLDDAGYLEAAMDWWLIYRQPVDLLTMADDVPCRSRRSFRDPLEQLAYLELSF